MKRRACSSRPQNFSFTSNVMIRPMRWISSRDRRPVRAYGSGCGGRTRTSRCALPEVDCARRPGRQEYVRLLRGVAAIMQAASAERLQDAGIVWHHESPVPVRRHRDGAVIGKPDDQMTGCRPAGWKPHPRGPGAWVTPHRVEAMPGGPRAPPGPGSARQGHTRSWRLGFGLPLSSVQPIDERIRLQVL